MSSEYFQFQIIPKIRTLGHTPTKIKLFSLDTLGKPWFIRNPIVTIIAKVKNKKYVRNKVGRSRPLVLENSSFRLIVLPQFYMSILQKPYSIYYNSRRYISTTIPLTVRSAWPRYAWATPALPFPATEILRYPYSHVPRYSILDIPHLQMMVFRRDIGLEKSKCWKRRHLLD